MHEVIQDIVLAMLRGMAAARPQPDSLRRRVRDVILADDPTLYDDFAVEALATLSPDLDDRAEAWPRNVIKERPGTLNPALRSLVVPLSVSGAWPQLLLDPAEGVLHRGTRPTRPLGRWPFAR